MIDFAQLHAGVVNPGGRASVNPYYLRLHSPGGYRKALGRYARRWRHALERS